MIQFCKEVLAFLKSEYSDAYSFEIELSQNFSGTVFTTRAELKIKVDSTYTIKLTEGYMNYLFTLYLEGTFIKERNQYVWQKELIDLIEGS